MEISSDLTPNDVSVLSKHDTSTNANDPHESELHSIRGPAIGRDAEQRMFVSSPSSGNSSGGSNQKIDTTVSVKTLPLPHGQ